MIYGNWTLEEDEVAEMNDLLENVNGLIGREFVNVENNEDDETLFNIFVDGKTYDTYCDYDSALSFLYGIKVAIEKGVTKNE